jgi:hypothetical protein
MLKIGFRIPAWALPRLESENAKQIPRRSRAKQKLGFYWDFILWQAPDQHE